MFIDANIFLEIALKDKNWEKCVKFINDAVINNRSLCTSDFIIYSCLIIIYDKLNSHLKMMDFLVFINSLGIDVIRPSLKAVYNAMEIMAKEKLDFDDALVISCMIENGIRDLISYDGHFDKIKNVNIIRP